MVPVPVVFGKWARNDRGWFFEVDHARGGRMFNLHDGCTHGEVREMAIEDYFLHTQAGLVELSYALPNAMLKQMPPTTPPMTVSTDRQVRNLMEFCQSHTVCLCVSVGKLSCGGNDNSVGHFADNMSHCSTCLYVSTSTQKDQLLIE